MAIKVEEMLIKRVIPIMHVTQSIHGKYKYNGNTITFSLDISTITLNTKLMNTLLITIVLWKH